MSKAKNQETTVETKNTEVKANLNEVGSHPYHSSS